MKTKIYVLLIAVITIVISCKKEQKSTIDYTIISGTIDSIAKGEIRLSKIDGFRKTLNIKDGKFQDTLRIDEGMYTISYPSSQSKIYISHGSNIKLSANGNDYSNTIVYSGDHADINSYFLNKSKTHIEFFKNADKTFVVDETEFTKVISEKKAKDESALEALIDFPESYKEREKKSLRYAYLYKKFVYVTSHSYYAKKAGFVASPEFEKELIEMPLNNANDFFYSSNYNRLVGSKINNETRKLMDKDSIPFELAKIETTVSQIKNEKIKNDILFKDIKSGLALSKIKKEFLNAFLNNSSNEDNKNEIKQLFEEVAALDPGNPSPNFADYKNYAGGTKSLNDFKGKYVYIDVWATWCGPCKYELPFLKKVEEEYHNKNIEFLSISVDANKDYDKWTKMIKDDEMKGVQLFADKSFDSDFIKSYKINGIPQFMLLDPEGNIVDANAPRPSSKELIELFKQRGI